MPVDSLQEQEGRGAEGRFTKGHSGNPQGRRPGSRNKATEVAELLLDSEAETLTRRAVELALDGQLGALRLYLDSIIPPRRQRAQRLGPPPVRGIDDLGGTMAVITTAATEGALTTGEGGRARPRIAR
jgi:hypothetical protein